VIGLPLNDHQCLGGIAEQLVELVKDKNEALAASTRQFASTAALASFIRGLPQRDDLGDEDDGPRVAACEPSQRLRIPAEDPNCVERASWYIAAAELIDPQPVRQLATIDTPVGPHTIAIENGVPVILDPRVSRNAAEGGLFQLEDGPVEMHPREAVDWLGALAEEPAQRFRYGRARVRNGCRALQGVLNGRALTMEETPDAMFVLVLGEREARLFGPRGVAVARCTIGALSDLEKRGQRRCAPQPRNAELRLGGWRIKPNLGLLSAFGRIGGRVGYRVGVAALRAKLATMGVTPLMLGEVEQELNREGLSLGALATPAPMPGTLAAVTPDAMAGRRIAGRIG